jgi:predicted Zn-dependent peptidase
MPALYKEPVPTRFENGMVAWSIRNEMLSASLYGFIRGCRYDGPKAIGSAHFGEHLWCHGVPDSVAALIRKRCPGRPAPVTERKANRTYRKYLGGSNGPGMNIFTDHSRVGFGHQDLFNPDYLDEVSPVIGGMVHDGMQDARDLKVRAHSVVSPRIFDIERSAVLHETAENDEHPFMVGYRAALKELYAVNPARNFGDSEPTQLTAMRPEQINFWLQSNLVPSMLRIIFIGPTQNEAVRLIRQTGLNNIPDMKPAPWWYDRTDDVPRLENVKRVDFVGTGRMSHVQMLWPTDPYGCRSMYPLQVLAGIMKDRIEDEQRERLLSVYHPDAEWEATSSSGYLRVSFSTLKRGDELEHIIRRVLDVLDGIVNDRSDEFAEDVQDGRFYLASSFLEDYLYTPGAFADRMLVALANGDPELNRFNGFYSDMRHVSPERVRNAAKKYLRRDAHVLSVVRPAD